MLSRRTLLMSLAAADPFTIRRITNGPKFHWFGYYDKLQFDPAGRFVLSNQVDFEHRSPKPDDEIAVGVIDTGDGDRWRELGRTRAWNWQQGCMLQFIPGRKDEVMWNDRVDGDFVCHIANIRTGRSRAIPSAVYALSPDGKWGVTCDFRRLNDCRPGYGYAGVPDPNAANLAPEDAGVWRVDLATGKRRMLFSIADAARVPNPNAEWTGAKHWFNHLLISPDGKRVIFLHRWRGPKEGTGFATRMFTIGADGRDAYALDPHGKTSHFVWRDPQHVIAWAWHPSHGEKFYLYKDRTDQVEVLGKDAMTVNGHVSYLPGNRWLINDTYPDRERMQNPYLYEIATGRATPLGRYFSPKKYAGEWRCDTHPRFSPDGRAICIDSPHEGGRQMYLIDIARIVG